LEGASNHGGEVLDTKKKKEFNRPLELTRNIKPTEVTCVGELKIPPGRAWTVVCAMQQNGHGGVNGPETSRASGQIHEKGD